MEHESVQSTYDPNKLLDGLIERLNLKNDAALCRALDVGPPLISKIRHRRLSVGAALLIQMHDISSLSIKELRLLMGDRRNNYRFNEKHAIPGKASAARARSQPCGPASSSQQSECVIDVE